MRTLQTEIDRSEVSRALAKAIAYKNCGKDGVRGTMGAGTG